MSATRRFRDVAAARQFGEQIGRSLRDAGAKADRTPLGDGYTMTVWITSSVIETVQFEMAKRANAIAVARLIVYRTDVAR